MLFSKEIDNAMKLGYNFEILWGYTFEKQIIFKDYVDSLYNMRLSYKKDTAMNYICKILMNSLYGKFGMDDLFDECMVIDKENLESNKHLTNIDEINKSLVKDIIEIGDNFIIKIERDKTSTYLDNGSETHNVNIGIASAITGYARIYMAQFKNNPNLKLFYTDTDSIYTNLNPDEMNVLFASKDATDMVSNIGLGKLKLESVSEKAIFLCPKVYFLKNKENEIIMKVKGLKKNIILTENEFESLLIKDNKITKIQDKWYRFLGGDNGIIIKEMEYSLGNTDNKRKLIYDNELLVATKPYNVIDNKIE